jgi:mannose-6-phosphate isomerase
MTTQLYPLLTHPRLVEPIWGGTRLAAWLNLPEPHPQRLGETWQVFDSNKVVNGPLAGYSLADLATTYADALVGRRAVARYGADIPLLAKFIDAADRLSIQVHPDDDYAHRVEADTGFHGKTEAWYILAAEPGATITYGLNATVERTHFAEAVQQEQLETLLQQVKVQAGDVVFVPAGTIHAINAGIMLFEIQQKSDLTYRVYDYGRIDAHTGQPRALHLDKALAVSSFAAAPSGKIRPLAIEPDGARQLLIACPSFALERWHLLRERETLTDPGSLEILTVIGGAAHLTWEGGSITIEHGRSLVLPADLGTWAITPAATDTILLRAYIPFLPDLADMLIDLGHPSEQIAEVVRE